MKVEGIRCLKCDDRIWSRHQHDFKWCKCGAVAIDGGRSYFRVVGSKDKWEEVEIETGEDRLPASFTVPR